MADLAAVDVVLARVALAALRVAIPRHHLVLADLQQAALKDQKSCSWLSIETNWAAVVAQALGFFLLYP